MFEKAKKIFSGKKVLLVGLGLHGGGAGSAVFFQKAGAKLTVTDLKPKADLASALKKVSESPVKLTLGKHKKEDFKKTDIIVKNPAVPYESPFIAYARSLGKPIFSDAQIFFNLVPREKIIGVTGTKGKSTTCRLLYFFLKKRFRVKLVGMPNSSPLEDLLKIGDILPDYFIYELSSFALENLKISPKYALITNIFPDHLNRHSSFKEYLKAKENIFAFQKKGDIVFLNESDPISASLAKKAKKGQKIVFFDGKHSSFAMSKSIQSRLISPTSVNGARKAALFFKIKPKDISEALASYLPENGRLEYIGSVKGARVINDTTATNPEASLFSIKLALKCFGMAKNRLILIAGGEDKNLDYHDFSRQIAGLKKIILLPGSATDKIIDSCREFSCPRIFLASAMPEAVKKSFESAKKGDLILFSPASASFNLFKNEFDRGRRFISSVRKLGDLTPK